MDKDAILAHAILCLMGASCSWLGKIIGNKGQKKSPNSATDGLSYFISTMKWALPTSPIWTCQGPGSHSSPRATCPSEAAAGSGCNSPQPCPARPWPLPNWAHACAYGPGLSLVPAPWRCPMPKAAAVPVPPMPWFWWGTGLPRETPMSLTA